MLSCGLRAVLAGALLAFASAVPAAAASGDFAIVPPALIGWLPTQAATSVGEKVIRAAEKGLSKPPSPMVHASVSGLLPGQGMHDTSHEAFKDIGLMRDFALAYRLTGDRKYLDATAHYVQAWVSTYKSEFQPIDDTHFYPLFVAYDLTRSDLPPQLTAQVDAWMHDFATGYLNEMHSWKKINNYQSHSVALVTLAAYSTGDPNLIAAARAAFQKQISDNVRADGSVYDYADRDALHYVTYDLDPLLMAADAARLHGEDWYHYVGSSGGSLPAAVAWLTPYATGQKTHDEFVNSKVAFDQQRAQAGVEGFQGNWNPSGSIETYSWATALDPANRSILEANLAASHGKVPEWVSLVVLGAGART